MELRLTALDAATSTNELVKRAIEEGEPEGYAVTARVQTAGYGRQGRTWASPAGGMYLSVLLRPQVPLFELPTLSLVAGMAVRRAVAGLLGDDVGRHVKVKWPNDVVLDFTGADVPAERADATASSSAESCGSKPSSPAEGGFVGLSLQSSALDAASLTLQASGESHSAGALAAAPFRKISGISLEQHAGGICVGIGVNVVPPADGAEPGRIGGKNVPAYMADLIADAESACDATRRHDAEPFCDAMRGQGAAVRAAAGCNTSEDLVDRVRDAVLRELFSLYERWTAGGFAPLLPEYAAHAALSGMRVSIVDMDGSVQVAGRVQGVDTFGRLLVLPDGADDAVAVSSGEAHVVLS